MNSLKEIKRLEASIGHIEEVSAKMIESRRDQIDGLRRKIYDESPTGKMRVVLQTLGKDFEKVYEKPELIIAALNEIDSSGDWNKVEDYDKHFLISSTYEEILRDQTIKYLLLCRRSYTSHNETTVETDHQLLITSSDRNIHHILPIFDCLSGKTNFFRSEKLGAVAVFMDDAIEALRPVPEKKTK